MALEKKNPAPLAKAAGSECVYLRAADDNRSSSANLGAIQAHHLRQRFGISPAHAGVVAELAFQAVRS